ncbi:putative Glutathione S-transferase 1 [Hypsibius exemplaris]|uniref:Glutathione S-transferase 1 n=1 Tax=Hypsibius exemplaris TaxID=2072580 RepID=A0A9X6NCA9_HYPEX|nr:putative Glutathione S-transferase 1 [Hypsibius exemplaris]
MVAYALTYFNVAGRAELIRLLFIVSGTLFTDNRIESAQWPALKANTTWGSLPYLEVDGKILGQSNAIVYYVSNQLGLGGEGEWNRAIVQSIVLATNDIKDGLSQFVRGDPSLKEKNLSKLKDATIPTILGRAEKVIQVYGSDDYSVGSKLTVADLALYDTIRQVEANKQTGITNIAANYPRIAKCGAPIDVTELGLIVGQVMELSGTTYNAALPASLWDPKRGNCIQCTNTVQDEIARCRGGQQ